MLEKRDLDELRGLMDGSVQASEERMRGYMDESVRASEERMRGYMDESVRASEERMRGYMDESVRASEERMRGYMDESVRASEERIFAYLEGKYDPMFQLLAEGQKTLLETLAPVSRVEKLEDEVAFLKQMLKTLASEIQDLKRAQ